MEDMKRHRATVKGGRVRVDVPTDIPDGAEVDVIIHYDDGPTLEQMDPAEREELLDGIEESEQQIARGETVSASELVRRLRDRQ